MISFKVTNRFTGFVQFTAKIACGKDEPESTKLGLAVKWAHETGATLTGAYLTGANLRGANLGGAYLRGADLGEKKIADLVARATRNDGYEFFLFRFEDGSHIIRAGCQTRTIESYHEHVASDYPDTNKARETLALLAYFEGRLADTAPALTKERYDPR